MSEVLKRKRMETEKLIESQEPAKKDGPSQDDKDERKARLLA